MRRVRTPNLQGEAPGRCPAGCAEARRAWTAAAQGLAALANRPQKEGEKLNLQLILRDNDKMGTVREQLGDEIIMFGK